MSQAPQPSTGVHGRPPPLQYKRSTLPLSSAVTECRSFSGGRPGDPHGTPVVANRPSLSGPRRHERKRVCAVCGGDVSGCRRYTGCVTAAYDYEDMHHLVDRLSLAQVRHLRVLVESDPELSPLVDAEEREDAPVRRRILSFIGSMESGRGDLSERHSEIIREGLSYPG